jgi:hypothetical protein
MILNEKNKTPFLTFGLGRKEFSLSMGKTINISQIEILNPENYSMTYNGSPVSLYGFDFEALELGTHEFKVVLTNTSGRETESTPIFLEVTLRADSDFITADSNEITADGSQI